MQVFSDKVFLVERTRLERELDPIGLVLEPEGSNKGRLGVESRGDRESRIQAPEEGSGEEEFPCRKTRNPRQ